MRDHFGRHACNRSTGGDILNDYSTSAYRSALADMHAFDNAHRRANIYFILYDRAMEVQTPNSGKVSEVNIITYHCRGIDNHRTAVQQQEAIPYLCGSRNVDMILLRHLPSDEP